MFAKKPKPKTGLETAIDAALEDLEGRDSDSTEYAAIVDQIVKLHALTPKKDNRVKADTWVNVGGSLLGIFSIIGYEKFNVVSSKALGFVMKPRA